MIDALSCSSERSFFAPKQTKNAPPKKKVDVLWILYSTNVKCNIKQSLWAQWLTALSFFKNFASRLVTKNNRSIFRLLPPLFPLAPAAAVE